MISRIFFGSPLQSEIDEITSEEQLGQDIDFSSSLNYSDKVRSKEYSAKDVVKCLQKRLEYPNPNVKIKTVKLTDLLVKNAGRLFLLEVSSREFIDSLVAVLDNQSGDSIELKQEILKALYTWSVAFKDDRDLSYVPEIYKKLKYQGMIYNAEDISVVGKLVETSQAPDWVDSPHCMRCRTSFTISNRKHHCRHCGKCFCNDCSNIFMPIPKFGIHNDVRVCQSCYLELKAPPRPNKPKSTPLIKDAPLPRPHTRDAPDIDDEDEDLKKAIEISLQDSTKPQILAQTNEFSETYLAQREEMDFKQAIEASLKENTPARPNYNHQSPYPSNDQPFSGITTDNSGYPQLDATYNYDNGSDNTSDYNYNYPSFDTEPEKGESSGNVLTNAELEDISLFKSLLSQIKSQGKSVNDSQQTQYLYESISEIKPKVQQEIDAIDEKHQKLLGLHERIMTAIRIYDQLLEQKLTKVKRGDVSNPAVTAFNSFNQAVPDASGPPQFGYYPNQTSDYYGNAAASGYNRLNPSAVGKYELSNSPSRPGYQDSNTNTYYNPHNPPNPHNSKDPYQRPGPQSQTPYYNHMPNPQNAPGVNAPDAFVPHTKHNHSGYQAPAPHYSEYNQPHSESQPIPHHNSMNQVYHHESAESGAYHSSSGNKVEPDPQSYGYVPQEALSYTTGAPNTQYANTNPSTNPVQNPPSSYQPPPQIQPLPNIKPIPTSIPHNSQSFTTNDHGNGANTGGNNNEQSKESAVEEGDLIQF